MERQRQNLPARMFLNSVSANTHLRTQTRCQKTLCALCVLKTPPPVSLTIMTFSKRIILMWKTTQIFRFPVQTTRNLSFPIIVIPSNLTGNRLAIHAMTWMRTCLKLTSPKPTSASIILLTPVVIRMTSASKLPSSVPTPTIRKPSQ